MIVGDKLGLHKAVAAAGSINSIEPAVVVLANSRQNVPDTGTPTAKAERVARDILFALFYNLP